MSVISIISHTPVWVWFLFAFLVLSGLAALRPRKSRPVMMLLLPLFFFVWGLYAIFLKLPGWPVVLAVFIVTMALGFWVGWRLAGRFPAASYDREARRIERPGTPLTLFLVVFSFLAKYVLSVIIAINPEMSATIEFSVIYGATSGLISGNFWGIMTLQFRQAFNSPKQGGRAPT